MLWKTECDRMRLLIGLCVGDDVDEEERAEVRRHVSTCPNCRDQWVRLQSGQKVLELAGNPSAAEEVERTSVWPQLQRQIVSLQSRPASRNWQRWVPVGALAAACLGMLVSSPAFHASPDAMDSSGGYAAQQAESGYPRIWRGQGLQVGGDLSWLPSRAEMSSRRPWLGREMEGWQRVEPVRVKPFNSFPPLSEEDKILE